LKNKSYREKRKSEKKTSQINRTKREKAHSGEKKERNDFYLLDWGKNLKEK